MSQDVGVRKGGVRQEARIQWCLVTWRKGVILGGRERVMLSNHKAENQSDSVAEEQVTEETGEVHEINAHRAVEGYMISKWDQ